MPIEFSKAYIAYTEMIDPSIRFDSECVLEYKDRVYLKSRQILKEYNSRTLLNLYLFLSIGIGLIIILGIILTIRYFCKNNFRKCCKRDENEEDGGNEENEEFKKVIKEDNNTSMYSSRNINATGNPSETIDKNQSSIGGSE